MARRQTAIVGAITGFFHVPTTRVFQGGQSLHPLQRMGAVPAPTYYPPGAMSGARVDTAPAAANTPSSLIWPAMLKPGVSHLPAVRV